jgi:tyrosine-protein kinase Etk/Wzc
VGIGRCHFGQHPHSFVPLILPDLAQDIPDFFNQKSGGFHLKSLLYHYIGRYWYWYVLFPALGYAVAWAYLRYTVPEYEVTCSLLIKDSDKGSGLSETALLKELGAMQENNNVENEIQVLKSSTLMQQVVEELNLGVQYFAVGRVREEEMYRNSYVLVDSFRLHQRGAQIAIQYVNDSSFTWKTAQNEGTSHFGRWCSTPVGNFLLRRDSTQRVLDQGRLTLRIIPADKLARQLGGNLSVKPMSFYASVLELKLRDPMAQRAADVLNKLVEAYNRAALKDKNEVGENTIKFIDQRLLYLTEELSGVEGGVQRYKQQHLIGTTIESGMGLVLEEMSEFDNRIAALELQRSIQQSMDAFLRAMVEGKFQLAPANLHQSDVAFNQLLQRYNNSILAKEQLLQTAKPDNPAVKNLQAEIQSLHVNLLETIQKLEQQTRSALEQTRAQKATLTGKVRETPRMERELQEIMRQQSIKLNLYLFLLQKREETLLALASTTGNSRVVDPAFPNETPVKPQRRFVYVMALLMGCLVPAFLVLLRDLLNDTIESEADIKQICDVPILGGIAFSRTGKNIVVDAKSRSSVAEMFRLLRTNLQFVLPPGQQSGHRILITSSASGDGKTFVTANLGMALAISGKKTVLMELDLRKPKLSQYTGSSGQDSGITNYLLGHAKVQNIIRKTTLHDNLYLISSGILPPNPAELVLSPLLDQLLEQLQQEFDFILIDTPPVGLVADALLLNRFATASMYVVRQGATQKAMLKRLAEIQEQQKLTQLTAVLNSIKHDGSTQYGYGYGYGYGYYDDEKPTRWWHKWKQKK